jgi:hypothetical protein
MKKWKLDRIISIATLVASVAALVLVLKRPAPVAAPQTPAQVAANAQSFQKKIEQLDQAPAAQTESALDESSEAQPMQPSAASPAQTAPPVGQAAPTPAQVSLTSNEVSAALAQAAGALSGGGGLTAGSDIGAMPNILDQQVSFDGDQAHGQFLVNIAGKSVWVTVSGHLGSKNGYATFEPTEFKVGDLNIPVSLVNPALQQRLAQQHDRLKLPDNVGGIQVKDGQLVLTQR